MVDFKINTVFGKSNEIVAISVGHSSQGMLHNKILYNFNGEIKEMHLGFHHLFFNCDINSPQSYIFECPKFPKSRLKSLAAKCVVIAENQAKNNGNNLPYAFGYYSGREFDQNGVYTDNKGIEYGMTCATFVLTVFHSVGLQLLDWENWVYRAEDDYFFQKIIKILESQYLKGKVSKTHLENVKKETKCARFRPEEVFSSVYCGNRPSSLFECTNRFGELVKPLVLRLPSEY